MKRVLVTEPIHEDGIALITAREGLEVIQAENTKPATLAKLLPGTHGIAVRTAELNAELLSISPELQIVSRHGVGCDNLDVSYLTDRGIPIAIAAGANSSSVAELTFSMLLTLTRRLRELDYAVRNNDFAARSRILGQDLEGSNLMVLGFGRIGRKVAARARAFDMNVIVADNALDYRMAEELGCKAISDFRAELANIDILSVHIPLDRTTHHIISEKELALIKPGAILINCARGGIIDENALLKALELGKLSGAGLDVFSIEPPPPDNFVLARLLARDDVVLTPHAGAGSTGAMRAMAIMAVQNILDFFDGNLAPDCTFNHQVLEKR